MRTSLVLVLVTRVASVATLRLASPVTGHAAAAAAYRHRPVHLMTPPPPPDEQQAKLTKLLVSVLIDLIGMATYVVPLAGEAGDLAWAPISALLIYQLYGNGLITGLAFAEELLPGLDIIPTATIAWLLENTELGQNLNSKAPDSQSTSAPPSSAGPPRRASADGDGMRRADGTVVGDE